MVETPESVCFDPESGIHNRSLSIGSEHAHVNYAAESWIWDATQHEARFGEDGPYAWMKSPLVRDRTYHVNLRCMNRAHLHTLCATSARFMADYTAPHCRFPQP
jgi:hypothetical protein